MTRITTDGLLALGFDPDLVLRDGKGKGRAQMFKRDNDWVLYVGVSLEVSSLEQVKDLLNKLGIGIR